MKRLKIKLISPKMSLRPMDSEFKRRMSPSLSLVTIASLTPIEHFVYIEDENIKKLNFDDNPDIVGINVNVDTSQRAAEIASIYRAKGAKVVFGGIHASANPDDMLNYCDSVCIGEAEPVWTSILDDVLQNRLKEKYFVSDITDMNSYPIPNWDYIDKNNYLYSNIVITSRGCPFRCEFCYNSCQYINHQYRNRPIEDVIKEIDQIKSKQVFFIDDNLIGNKHWLFLLLKQLVHRNIKWHAAVSANIVNDKRLIDLMAYSGCKSLFIGFESINENSLKAANKTQNRIDKYEELISYLHSKSIMVNASLVFGFDNDSADVFPRTLEWLIKNKIETMTSHILTPYPGTELYNKLLKENRITDFNLKNYNTSNVVFKPKLMTAEELKQGYLWMYKSLYSHRNIIKRIPDNTKLIYPFIMFNYGYRKYGKLFSKIGSVGMMNYLGRLGTRLSYGIG